MISYRKNANSIWTTQLLIKRRQIPPRTAIRGGGEGEKGENIQSIQQTIDCNYEIQRSVKNKTILRQRNAGMIYDYIYGKATVIAFRKNKAGKKRRKSRKEKESEESTLKLTFRWGNPGAVNATNGQWTINSWRKEHESYRLQWVSTVDKVRPSEGGPITSTTSSKQNINCQLSLRIVCECKEF